MKIAKIISANAVKQTTSLSWRPLRLLLDAITGKDSYPLLKEYLKFTVTMVKHHGLGTTTKVLKDLDDRTKLVAIGQEIPRGPYGSVWLKTNPLGLPKKLPELKRWVINNPRQATQVTCLVRLITLPPSLSTETITSPNTHSWPPSWLDDYSLYVNNHLSQVTMKPCDWHSTTKSGPNGPAAIISSGIDAIANAMSPGSDWQFRYWCHQTGNNHVEEKYDKFISHFCQNDYPNLKWPSKITNAKLAFLSDKAGKTRVIYILNYWWQELLKPLHNAVFKWLSHQKQDGTFDQTKCIDVVKSWTEQGKPCYCYDLTAATDRWPRDHQVIAIRALAGQIWSECWMDAMAIPPWNPHNRSYLWYSVGQPMGAYSSWAALAISHHMLIRYSAFLTKQAWTDAYVVLGDDVVISNKEIAEKYISLLTSLGVTISPGKSVLPERQKHGYSAEFAKQILYCGQDFTPISPKLLEEIYDNHFTWKFIELLQVVKEKYGWTILSNSECIWLPSPLKDLWTSLPRKSLKKLKVLISFPDGPFGLLKEVQEGFKPSELDYPITWENPWNKIGKMNRQIQHLAIIEDELSEKVSKLMKFRDSFKQSDSGSLLPGWLLENPYHPIYEVINRIDIAIKKVCSTIDNADSLYSKEMRDLEMDVDFLENLMIKGVSYNEWKDQKSRRLKLATQKIIRLHYKVTQPIEDQYDCDYDGW